MKTLNLCIWAFNLVSFSAQGAAILAGVSAAMLVFVWRVMR